MVSCTAAWMFVPLAVAGPTSAVTLVAHLEAPTEGYVYQRLLGVDPETNTGFVAISDTQQVPLEPHHGSYVVEIDLSTGAQLGRWGKTVGDADESRKREFGHLWPLVDSEADLAWLASVFARIDTQAGRGSHELELSPDRRWVVHHRTGGGRSMGDWLTLRDRDGTHPVRLAAPWVAAYLPTFSPDGTQVAYTAHVGASDGGDPYRLVLTDLAGALAGSPTERRVDGLGHVTEIRWGADGALYTLDDSGTPPRCLRRIDTEALAAEPVVCSESTDTVRLVIADGGSHAVWSTFHRETVLSETVWFTLPQGTVTGRRTAPGGVLDLRDDGVTLLVDRDLLRVVDPGTGREASIPGIYVAAGQSRWVHGRLLVGRIERGKRGLDLVWIDPDAALH